MHSLGDRPEEESSPHTHVLVFYCEPIQLSHVSHLYTKTGQTLTISYSLPFELSLSNLKTVWTLWILFIISLKQIEQKQTYVHSYMTWSSTDILRNCPCWWTQLSGDVCLMSSDTEGCSVVTQIRQYVIGTFSLPSFIWEVFNVYLQDTGYHRQHQAVNI